MTTPSSSATTTSPGFTVWPAMTSGRFTLPRLSLTVPCADTARDHTGNFISVSAFTSRQPASMTSPRTPAALERGGQQLAEVAVVAGRGRRHHEDVALAAHLDGDVDHPVVAGRHRNGDGIAGGRGAGIDRAHVGGEQALATLRLVDGGDAELGQRLDVGERRALEVLDDDAAHANSSGVVGEDRLIALGVGAALGAAVAPALVAAPQRHVGVVLPQVLLAGHAFDRRALLVPHAA